MKEDNSSIKPTYNHRNLCSTPTNPSHNSLQNSTLPELHELSINPLHIVEEKHAEHSHTSTSIHEDSTNFDVIREEDLEGTWGEESEDDPSDFSQAFPEHEIGMDVSGTWETVEPGKR